MAILETVKLVLEILAVLLAIGQAVAYMVNLWRTVEPEPEYLASPRGFEPLLPA